MRICHLDNIHILALSETHLDSAMNDAELMVDGYKLYRKDRDKYWGGVAFYIKHNFGVILRDDLITSNIEVIRIEISVPYCKSILAGCFYCINIDRVTEENKDIFVLGDFNIDWFSKNCFFDKKVKING